MDAAGRNGMIEIILPSTKDSLRTCEEQLVWIFAGFDEINYHPNSVEITRNSF